MLKMKASPYKASIEEHIFRYFYLLCEAEDPSLGNIEEEEDVIRYCLDSSFPLYNGVFPKQSLFGDWKKTVDRHLDFFKEKQLPHSWWITEDDAEQSRYVAEYLKEKGMTTPGKFYVETLNREDAPTELMETPAGISIKRVETAEDLSLFVDLMYTVFFPESEDVRQLLQRCFPKIGCNGPFYHYLTYMGDKPVGTGSLLITKNAKGEVIAGLWNGAVLEEARRQGAGLTNAQHRIQEAWKLGAHTINCMLMADGMARGYCQRLGLQTSFTITPYFG